jgi:hypothetical protein
MDISMLVKGRRMITVAQDHLFSLLVLCFARLMDDLMRSVVQIYLILKDFGLVLHRWGLIGFV